MNRFRRPPPARRVPAPVVRPAPVAQPVIQQPVPAPMQTAPMRPVQAAPVAPGSNMFTTMPVASPLGAVRQVQNQAAPAPVVSPGQRDTIMPVNPVSQNAAGINSGELGVPWDQRFG